MKKMSMLLAVLTLVPAPALAADYKCQGNRVEKGGSTRYTVRASGPDIVIEKGGSTRGRAVKRGDDYAVEVGGSTQATIENGRIYKGGSTWSSVGEAQRVYDCPDIVAATLWVLQQQGQL
ncbi:hypothetical protein [Archangium violaceum]|uniref:Uncharacterized protein n=1 Tax=Archangium violaceum Cb vi76 TaxID=1406225 RepID=A0A084T2A3_9BACT|nr:hypothetical protein [Archangium violaceum]KFA94838.1 hypothetical protein Q664_00265 [Archangium violaceum Cb vi76]